MGSGWSTIDSLSLPLEGTPKDRQHEQVISLFKYGTVHRSGPSRSFGMRFGEGGGSLVWISGWEGSFTPLMSLVCFSQSEASSGRGSSSRDALLFNVRLNHPDTLYRYQKCPLLTLPTQTLSRQHSAPVKPPPSPPSLCI